MQIGQGVKRPASAGNLDAGGGAHVRLSDLAGRPDVRVQGVYAMVAPEVKSTRNGQDFLSCRLRDGSGECVAVMWSYDRARFGEMTATGFVHVNGRSGEFNGQPQVIIDDARAVEVSPEELLEILPATERDRDDLFARAVRLLDSLDHPGMKALAKAYLADETLMERFRLAPAAQHMHHAFLGGLLEHTVEMMELADAMLPLVGRPGRWRPEPPAPGELPRPGEPAPPLDRDLVLLGLFIHDLAKVDELSVERGFAYTADGHLVGHIARGVTRLRDKVRTLPEGTMSEEAVVLLEHILLSHHGRPEHGALKVPSTPEAVFVASLDHLHAKTAMAIDAADRDAIPDGGLGPAEEIGPRHFGLETRVYRPNPLREG